VTDAATIGRLRALGFGGWVPTGQIGSTVAALAAEDRAGARIYAELLSAEARAHARTHYTHSSTRTHEHAHKRAQT
jgi:hypothetical protein